jgi:50S ribosomal subunit-associated GTPase HflX
MEKIKITKKVLLDTGVDNEKINNMITVFNKVDKFNNKIFINSKNKFYVSALKKIGIENLKTGLSAVITE